MKIWHPVAIAQNTDVITLTMNENQVTNAIYMAVIKGVSVRHCGQMQRKRRT
jgi:hypothetical protein